jgi:predicted YcjX-like family ATPase
VRAEQALQFNRRLIQKIDFLAIAAHRCTDDVDTDHDGKPIVAMRGRLNPNDKDESLYFPGRVPQQWPEHKEDWRSFRFPDFLPRKLPDIATGRPLPHIKMDQILFALVEDLLR